MTKLLFFSGSSRKGSANFRLVQAASKLMKRTFGDDVSITDIKLSDYDMPPYDSEVDGGAELPENACKLRKILASSDGVFMGADEYTGAYSALFRNSIGWMMRDESDETPFFRGKVIALCGASPGGVGGLRGQPALHQLLSVMGAIVIPQHISLGTSSSPFDANGELLPRVEKQLQNGVIPRLYHAANTSVSDSRA